MIKSFRGNFCLGLGGNGMGWDGVQGWEWVGLAMPRGFTVALAPFYANKFAST